MFRALCLTFTLLSSLLAALPAQAHNVIASVFASGEAIEGEVGFSNGEMASDLLIEVYDDSGQKLGETRTDEDGFFLYTPLSPVTHVFRGDLGAGHVADVRMEAAEVAEILRVAPQDGTDTPQPAAGNMAGTIAWKQMNTNTLPSTASPLAAAMSDQTRAELAAMIRTELRPLRREITALKNKSDFQSVLGGIGYIFGLFGLGFYLAAQSRLKRAEQLAAGQSENGPDNEGPENKGPNA